MSKVEREVVVSAPPESVTGVQAPLNVPIYQLLGGKVRGDRVYMPAFAGILSQEAIWAIKAYVETRPAE